MKCKRYELYEDMLRQPHLLIAGATGSGKSVIINGLIYTLLIKDPADVGLILIDPKRVELIQYKYTSSCMKYASEQEDMIRTLDWCVELMEQRYKEMQRNRQRSYSGKKIYVFVDELADLLTTSKKQVLPMIQRLAQLGRAAQIHLILATQRPTKDILSGQLKVNLDSRVALRVPTAVDSRNIINVAGAEDLPRYGQGYYLTPETMQPVLYNIPYYNDEQLDELINYRTSYSSTLGYKLSRLFQLPKRKTSWC